MNDLNQLLRDAADSGDGDRLDPHDLLVAGRRKVRNRGYAAAGVVTAVFVAAAAALTWLPTDDERPDVANDPDGHSTTYEEVRVPPGEVERRCSVVLNGLNSTTDVQYVAGKADDGTAISAGEDPDPDLHATTEGAVAYLMPVGRKWPRGEPDYGFQRSRLHYGTFGRDPHLVGETACVIPQADEVAAIPEALDSRLPKAAGAREVVDLCSAQTGYDLRGWEPLAAGTMGSSSAAIVMSENGYVATCTVHDRGWFSQLEIDPEPYLDEEGDPIPADSEDLAVGISYGSGPFSEARVLPGLPDDYMVSFSADGEVIAETTTNRGAYLISFRAPRDAVVTGRVTDRDGKVVYEAVVSR